MRAFVTGGSRGIGAATVRKLAADGFDVAVHGFHHPEEAEKEAAIVRGLGRSSFVVLRDLGSAAGPVDAAADLARQWDSLDVLVLNAGAYDRTPFPDITDDDLLACYRLNVFAPFALTRELLPLLRRSSAGRVVFVSSQLAFAGSPRGAHYASAKAAIVGLSRSLAKELAPGITVNTVAPGSIDTAILAGDTPERRRERGLAIPLGRVGEAAEVADAIAFLASGHASYVTGATLHVNGGSRID
ncbi:MAG: SDR family oxidoreductase [Thermoplasmata archaeon]|nr:SDR family oxidoreductase [Thermoplasmata archaeon]